MSDAFEASDTYVLYPLSTQFKKQNAKDIDKEVAKAKPNNREEVLDNIDFFWLTIKHQISAALRTANAQ